MRLIGGGMIVQGDLDVAPSEAVRAMHEYGLPRAGNIFNFAYYHAIRRGVDDPCGCPAAGLPKRGPESPLRPPHPRNGGQGHDG